MKHHMNNRIIPQLICLTLYQSYNHCVCMQSSSLGCTRLPATFTVYVNNSQVINANYIPSISMCLLLDGRNHVISNGNICIHLYLFSNSAFFCSNNICSICCLVNCCCCVGNVFVISLFISLSLTSI